MVDAMGVTTSLYILAVSPYGCFRKMLYLVSLYAYHHVHVPVFVLFLGYTTPKSGIIHACGIAISSSSFHTLLVNSTVLTTCPITGIMHPKFDYHLSLVHFQLDWVIMESTVH